MVVPLTVLIRNQKNDSLQSVIIDVHNHVNLDEVQCSHFSCLIILKKFWMILFTIIVNGSGGK